MTCPATDCMWPAMALHGVAVIKEEFPTQKRLCWMRRTASHHAMGLLLLRALTTPHTAMALLHDAAPPNGPRQVLQVLPDKCLQQERPKLEHIFTSLDAFLPCKSEYTT